MRYLFGFLCVCALGVMPLVGCSETTGDGGGGSAGEAGTGGTAGSGGVGGMAGAGGSGGAAGEGGTGGMPECQEPEDCDDREECTTDACLSGICENTEVEDGIACDETNECAVGQCASGACELTSVTDGTACGDDAGTCQQGSCSVAACTEQGILDAIAAGGGPYTFDCGGPQTVITLAEIVIDNDVILDGEGNLTIDGNRDHRVFSVPSGVTAELHGLTVTRGTVTSLSLPGEMGGGILNDGQLTLVDCTVRDNAAEHGEDCYDPTPMSFGCEGVAGGIHNAGGTLMLQNSTVSANTADVYGGILNDGQGILIVLNSTVSANATMGIPGAADTSAIGNGPAGRLMLMYSTVSGNLGGAIGNEGEATVTNSLVDGECGGGVAIFSNRYNLESPGDTCGFDQIGDQSSVPDAMLGPLQDNGGLTETHALLPGSPAIDRIPEAVCKIFTDQRGESRPAGPDPKRCDVGAFEVQPAP